MSKNCSWNILTREHPWNFKVTSQREDWIHCCLKLNPTKDDLNIYFKDFNEEADFPNHLMRYIRGIKSRFEHQTSSEDVGRSSPNARRNSLDMMGCHGNMPQRGCNGNTHCVSENGGRIPIPGQQLNGVPMSALCSDPNPLWVLRILPWWIGFSPLNTWGATSHKWLLVSDMHVTWYNHPQIWDLNDNLEYHPEM